MKKAINQIRITATGLMIIFLASMFTPASATGRTDSSANLKFVGTFKNQPMFELSLNNVDDEEYMVLIKDGNSDVLYSGKLKGKNLSKKYQFDTFGDDFNSISFNVRFVVTNLKTNQTSTFNVVKDVRQVEDILVAKL
jgi:hypothetical protein